MYTKVEKNTEYLTENQIKAIIKKHLLSNGWQTHITQRVNYSLDIEATHGKERWIIEAVSCDSADSDIVVSFTSILGQLMQRMDSNYSKYSVAFPDIKPFRRLWERLPAQVKQKMGITALFINQAGMVSETAE